MPIPTPFSYSTTGASLPNSQGGSNAPCFGGVMRVLGEQPIETLHLYVILEDELPRQPDYPSIFMAIVAVLCVLGIVGISVFSAAPTERNVSFTLSVPGFHLAPVSKILKTTAIATGKGHRAAT